MTNLLSILADQKAAFDKAAEIAKRKNEDKKDCENDIAGTIAAAAQGEPSDLTTWAAYLVEKRAQLTVAKFEHKLNIARAENWLKETIENSRGTVSGLEGVLDAWQARTEALDGYKEFVGNLKQDVKDAKKAIGKLVEKHGQG